MKWPALILVMAMLTSSASAAGIDTRLYACTALHALIQTKGFVFIGNPDFEDFVVANASFCAGGHLPQLRSVPTRDQPECPVNYCVSASGPMGGSP